MIIGSLFFVISMLQAGDRTQLVVKFLNVKKGNAIFINTPSGKNVLIDSGDGKDGLLTMVKGMGIKRIDYAVITCPDSQNIGGFVELINGGIDIGEFYAPDAADAPADFLSLMEDIMQKQDKLSTGDKESAVMDALNNIKHFEFQNIAAGGVFSWDQNLSAVIIGPYQVYRKTRNDLENNSLVIKLTYGSHSFLITGNMQAEACRDITKLGSKIQATVMQIPGNGSGFSVSDSFYQKVAPKYAVVQLSAGQQAAPAIITLLKTQGTAIYSTAETGAVQFNSDGIALNVKTDK